MYLWKFFNVFATILQHTCAYLKIYLLHMNRSIFCHKDALHPIRLQLPWHFQVFFLQILITNNNISQHIQWRNFRRSSLPLESQMTFPRGPNASFYVCSVLCTLRLSMYTIVKTCIMWNYSQCPLVNCAESRKPCVRNHINSSTIIQPVFAKFFAPVLTSDLMLREYQKNFFIIAIYFSC